MNDRPGVPVLAICNRKGGTGKSTTAVNLAAELAARGRRVLLVDLDTQGHCALGLGMTAQPEALAHALFRGELAALADAVRPSRQNGLWLIAADQQFEHGSGNADSGLLAAALSDPALAARFDLVILDTPPSLDALLLNALVAAHWVLVPFVPHPLSFEGIRQLMRILFRVMARGNPGLKILGLLPTASAEHVRQHRAVNGDVSRQFGAHRVLAGIRSDIRLAEAFAAGKPIREYASKSRGAQDYAALAETLLPALMSAGRGTQARPAAPA